ncbi:cation:proton antiporter [Erysipelothrix piscisicarius]|uniref:cation:proton antiporter domain-containing protein n=1 Tax=Erysipelothrix piscisicarius TaxID=2485784 RepID=UPI002F9231DA
MLQIMLRLPVMIVSGIISGVMLGRLISALGNHTKYNGSPSYSFSLLFYKKTESVFPVASLLGIMVSAITIKEYNPQISDYLSQAMDSLWMVAEVFLFVLVGAQVDF